MSSTVRSYANSQLSRVDNIAPGAEVDNCRLERSASRSTPRRCKRTAVTEVGDQTVCFTVLIDTATNTGPLGTGKLACLVVALDPDSFVPALRPPTTSAPAADVPTERGETGLGVGRLLVGACRLCPLRGYPASFISIDCFPGSVPPIHPSPFCPVGARHPNTTPEPLYATRSHCRERRMGMHSQENGHRNKSGCRCAMDRQQEYSHRG